MGYVLHCTTKHGAFYTTPGLTRDQIDRTIASRGLVEDSRHVHYFKGADDREMRPITEVYVHEIRFSVGVFIS